MHTAVARCWLAVTLFSRFIYFHRICTCTHRHSGHYLRLFFYLQLFVCALKFSCYFLHHFFLFLFIRLKILLSLSLALSLSLGTYNFPILFCSILVIHSSLSVSVHPWCFDTLVCLYFPQATAAQAVALEYVCACV